MVGIISRIVKLIKRRRMASKLGVLFVRSATFQLPNTIKINNKTQVLNLPNENGVKVAFVDLLLDDCYGCNDLNRSGAQIKTVMDVGGNVGLFSLVARNTFPDAIIHSYEPNIQLESYLSVQAKSGEFDYFMEAVGLRDGFISLEFSDESVLTRSIHDDKGNVPQISFAKAIERLGGTVDLLKMDCEGGEWEMFEDKESWRKVKHLSMEYHLFETSHSEQALKDIIINLGFEITSFVPVDNYGLLLATRI